MRKFPEQKWLLWLVVILLITNILTLSFYWFKEKPAKAGVSAPVDREKKMGQFMVDELKLDAGQEAVYWKLRDTLISQQRPVLDSIRSAKKRFFDLLNEPHGAIYDSLLARRGEDIANLQRQLDLITIRHFEKVRAICKQDQILKFDTVISEIVNKMTWGRKPQVKSDSLRKN